MNKELVKKKDDLLLPLYLLTPVFIFVFIKPTALAYYIPFYFIMLFFKGETQKALNKAKEFLNPLGIKNYFVFTGLTILSILYSKYNFELLRNIFSEVIFDQMFRLLTVGSIILSFVAFYVITKKNSKDGLESPTLYLLLYIVLSPLTYLILLISYYYTLPFFLWICFYLLIDGIKSYLKYNKIPTFEDIKLYEFTTYLNDLNYQEQICISKLKERDINFSANNLKDKLSDLFLEIENTENPQIIDKYKSLISDGIFKKYTQKLSLENETEEGNYDEIKIIDLKIILGEQEDFYNSLTAFILTQEIYEVDKNKAIKRNYLRKIELSRREGAQTDVNNNSLSKNICPNCKRPIEDSNRLKCPYCYTIFSSGLNDWIITDISDRISNTQLTLPIIEENNDVILGLSDLKKTDAQFNIQNIKDKINYIFWTIFQAYKDNNKKALIGITTKQFANSFKIREFFNKANELNQMNLANTLDPESIKTGIIPEILDIQIPGIYHNDNKNVLLGIITWTIKGNDSEPFQSLYVLTRNRKVQTNPMKNFISSPCLHCNIIDEYIGKGNTNDFQTQNTDKIDTFYFNVCKKCNKIKNLENKDWLLSEIYEYDSVEASHHINALNEQYYLNNSQNTFDELTQENDTFYNDLPFIFGEETLEIKNKQENNEIVDELKILEGTTKYYSDKNNTVTNKKNQNYTFIEAEKDPDLRKAHTGAIDINLELKFVSQIKDEDSSFSIRKFKSRVKRAFKTLIECWATRDLKHSHLFLSDGVYEGLKTQIEFMISSSMINHFNDLQILDIIITNSDSNEYYNSFNVAIISKSICYSIFEKTKEIIGNTTEPEIFTTLLTLVRRKNIKTKTSKGLIEGFCPKCNKKIDNNHPYICPFCNTFIHSGNFDWIITQINFPTIKKKCYLNTIPGINKLIKRDSFFNNQIIEDRILFLFWNIIKATKYNSDFQIIKLITDKIPIISTKTKLNNLFSEYNKVAVKNIEIIGTYIDDNNTDILLVKLTWNGFSSTNNNNILPPESRDFNLRFWENSNEKNNNFENLIVLKRKTDAVTNLEKAFSDNCCPSCNNQLYLNRVILCYNCQKKLNDTSSNWIFSEIYSFEEKEAKEYILKVKKNNS